MLQATVRTNHDMFLFLPQSYAIISNSPSFLPQKVRTAEAVRIWKASFLRVRMKKNGAKFCIVVELLYFCTIKVKAVEKDIIRVSWE